MRKRHIYAYNAILDHVPGFRETISFFVEDPAVFQRLMTEVSTTYTAQTHQDTYYTMHQMNDKSRASRSDDTGSLKKTGIKYVDASLTISDGESFNHKNTRGFESLLFAKYLCPHRLSAAFAEDPERCAMLTCYWQFATIAYSLPPASGLNSMVAGL